MHYFDLLKQNWAAAATALGVWSMIATLLNRVPALTPDKNTAKWKLALHAFFIDWPAFLPKVDFRGIFGLPVNVPYLTLSKAPDDTSTTHAWLIFASVGLSYAIATSGCAGISAAQGTGAALAGITDVIQCAPDAYNTYSSAVRNGGAGWAAAVLETLQCAGKVYQDVSSVLKTQNVAQLERLMEDPNVLPDGVIVISGKLLAQANGNLPAADDQVWTKESLKRLARCYRMYRALYGSKVL